MTPDDLLAITKDTAIRAHEIYSYARELGMKVLDNFPELKEPIAIEMHSLVVTETTQDMAEKMLVNYELSRHHYEPMFKACHRYIDHQLQPSSDPLVDYQFAEALCRDIRSGDIARIVNHPIWQEEIKDLPVKSNSEAIVPKFYVVQCDDGQKVLTAEALPIHSQRDLIAANDELSRRIEQPIQVLYSTYSVDEMVGFLGHKPSTDMNTLTSSILNRTIQTDAALWPA